MGGPAYDTDSWILCICTHCGVISKAFLRRGSLLGAIICRFDNATHFCKRLWRRPKTDSSQLQNYFNQMKWMLCLTVIARTNMVLFWSQWLYLCNRTVEHWLCTHSSLGWPYLVGQNYLAANKCQLEVLLLTQPQPSTDSDWNGVGDKCQNETRGNLAMHTPPYTSLEQTHPTGLCCFVYTLQPHHTCANLLGGLQKCNHGDQRSYCLNPGQRHSL